eukprot:gb/GECG01015264.1/.p1 GENE.gb/GECG01015264.1/~~gb/GECG01015264.1/.p1  ORF type:complete len:102 (+),score=3.91 gb/GECG01015264.1/:1-306(+)
MYKYFFFDADARILSVVKARKHRRAGPIKVPMVQLYNCTMYKSEGHLEEFIVTRRTSFLLSWWIKIPLHSGAKTCQSPLQIFTASSGTTSSDVRYHVNRCA